MFWIEGLQRGRSTRTSIRKDAPLLSHVLDEVGHELSIRGVTSNEEIIKTEVC